MTTNDIYHTLLRDKFNMHTFRPGQLEVMHLLMEKNRLLCIQPTGYGKSLLYQLPSCLLGGITLVISPLLALMRDQIDQLTNRFQIPAASINSDQTNEENYLVRKQILENKFQILFTAPEQLDHIDRFEFFLQLPINLLVIDEAHCISTWGHDFRPSYRNILKFCQALENVNPNLKILGLTATADERVEQDIVGQLSSNQKHVQVWREKMDRPNIHLSVHYAKGMASKLTLCRYILTKMSGNGLIYCSTRENTELLAEYLKKEGLSIIAYHAGLESDEKRSIQEAFAKNSYQVIAATTALGMGIDKKDLRYIIHFDIPGSITAYYQEVGRAGRDGLKADGILIYDKADKHVHDYFIDSALPSENDFNVVLSTIRNAAEAPNLMTIKRQTGLHPTRVTVILAELIDQKFLLKKSVEGRQIYQIDRNDRRLDLSRYQTQFEVKTKELNKILRYAEQNNECRMALLRYALGDNSPKGCGRCDICLKQKPYEVPDSSEAREWLKKRPAIIAGYKSLKIAQGFSVFDSKLKTPLFIRFMKERAVNEELDPAILSLLLEHAKSIRMPVEGIVLVPSRTWKAQKKYALALADHLKVPLHSDLLSWSLVPEKRQGELLNNDQRVHNVDGKMQVNGSSLISANNLIIFDDYIGSAATIKEAAKCLRDVAKGQFIPITIAMIKWHLGKPGFI